MNLIQKKTLIYHGNNDYRDYLAHHGVLGMHWGIRRYQPYSIGYQRKGGEKGKFVSGGGSSKNIYGSLKKQNTSISYKVPKSIKYEYGDSDSDPEAKRNSERSIKAYENTVKYYQKYEPDKLKEFSSIAKKNGTDDLRDIHDFRKTYEGFHDNESKNEQPPSKDAVSNALNRVTKAEDTYDQLAKDYKPTKSADELSKLGSREFDSKFANELSKKAGFFYDEKAVGKHSKAAYELYDSVEEHGIAREEAIDIKRNDIAEAAKTQAIEKYPKALRGSYLAQTAGTAAYQKATKTNEYKKLSNELSRVQKENRAKHQAAEYRVVAAALRDLGYPVNDENIKKVWDYVITD